MDEQPEDKILDDTERMIRVKRTNEEINGEVWEAEVDLLANMMMKVYLAFENRGFDKKQAFDAMMFFAETQMSPGGGGELLILSSDDGGMP
jgi:hypothetical protein